PGVDFCDPQGKLRATFALGPTGTPGLGLYDANGRLRTSLDVPAANTPWLAFYHGSGKPAWELRSHPPGIHVQEDRSMRRWLRETLILGLFCCAVSGCGEPRYGYYGDPGYGYSPYSY